MSSQEQQPEHIAPTVSCAAILAGGKSARMGRDKAALPWQGGNFLDLIAATLSGLFEQVFVVSSHHAHQEQIHLPVIQDVYADRGPLGGIHAALLHCSGEHIFITACDTPRITAEALRSFLDHWDGSAAFVARTGDRLHPLFAIYEKSALSLIERALQQRRHSIRPLLDELNASFLDVGTLAAFQYGELLMNVNTQEDYRNLLKNRER
jgi:molybdopterin-guanine dinucleotide biosynthesis protein A